MKDGNQIEERGRDFPRGILGFTRVRKSGGGSINEPQNQVSRLDGSHIKSRAAVPGGQRKKGVGAA